MPSSKFANNIPGGIVIDGHVQGLGIARSLGEKGIPVVVAENKKGLARFSRYVKGYFRSPDYLSDELADFLIELADKNGLKGWVLFPTNDHIVHTISRNRDRLKEYFTFTVPELGIISRIYSKKETILAAKKSDVFAPKTYFPGDEENSDEVLFPAIVKGIEGFSFYKNIGKKTVIVNNRVELDSTLQEVEQKISLDKVMVQEVIPFGKQNKVVSFTAFCDRGEVKSFWAGKKLREHPIEFGTATFCESMLTPELVEPTRRLLKEINYTGVCEVEYILDLRDNTYKLIEINPRTWLWVSLARRCGIDYPAMIYYYSTGSEYTYPDRYESGVKWSHIWTDLVFSLLGIVKKKYTVGEILKSYSGKVEYGVWSLKDPKPFIMETILLPLIAKNRSAR
ncbi:MAG: hypothetical protein SCALA702_33660 [Melioribacteraceae bacterium]|nr:MAG: hypothetical protein SCALA702_33660 [Melioribacteraceae bacterium]